MTSNPSIHPTWGELYIGHYFLAGIKLIHKASITQMIETWKPSILCDIYVTVLYKNILYKQDNNIEKKTSKVLAIVNMHVQSDDFWMDKKRAIHANASQIVNYKCANW